ncbi:MAG TPA: hypothetical protein VM386_05325, partial [Acidimicrobiales bacterium]|nr:hypothetical protein [Acidimicrobiales bacterium]
RPELLRDPDGPENRLDTSSQARSAESVVMDGTFDAVVERAYRSLSDDFREVVALATCTA